MQQDISELMWDKKYAPKTIDEIVLDDVVKVKILAWLDKKDLEQHLLFCGEPGTGKTTLADIIINHLKCDVLRLKASSGKGGVEYISEEIGRFVTTFGFSKFKIVFFDEVDRLNSLQAQKALLSIMDDNKDKVRFIFTANHLNKLEQALVSRCCLVPFKTVDRKFIGRHVVKILEAEKIEFNKSDLASYIDTFYPDIRALVNAVQYNSVGGKLLSEVVSLDAERAIFQLLKEKDVVGISSMLYQVNFTKLYRYMFDHVEELVKDKRQAVEASLTIGAYLARDSYIADREVNFRACCIALTQGILVTM